MGMKPVAVPTYISCTLASSAGKHSRRAANVILPTGQIQEINSPIKAAELMFEAPNFFLVNSKSLQIGRRFWALNADEDLEMVNVYVMFPMKRVNSIVTAADMGPLLLTANSAAKKKRVLTEAIDLAQIMPAPAGDIWQENEEVAVPKLNLDDVEDFSTLEFKHRVSMSRSKKPLLETIAEESFPSR